MGRWIIFLVLALLFCPIIMAFAVAGGMIMAGALILVGATVFVWWVSARWDQLVPVQQLIGIVVPIILTLLGIFLILRGLGII